MQGSNKAWAGTAREQEVPVAATTGMAGGQVTVSIVSHGHEAWLPGLLAQLAQTGAGIVARVVLTHNVPGAQALLLDSSWPFELVQIRNDQAAGFGANHNRAFSHARTPLFCVLNPDVALQEPGIWQALAASAVDAGVGCAFPVLLNADGSIQDSIREAVTPWALIRRRVFGRREQRMDWVSAAFWVVPSAVFERLGGFDERYFMYCEDVDFCLRLQLAGLRLVRVPVHAVHPAQRHSHTRWRHLRWHVISLLRLWFGWPLWRYVYSRERT